MLGVGIIAVLFLALAGGIAYASTHHGFRGLTRLLTTTSRSGSRTLNLSLACVYLVFGIAVPLVFIIGNHDRSNAQVGGVRLTAQTQTGRELFADHCAVCHTLAADNAVGKIGPNLDTLKPTEATVLNTIANGCLQKPASSSAATNCLGYGTMPADLVQGQDAVDVAKFVSAVAGHT
ncbi:MAG TPA: cytochrome c [Solirubrobacteraceae bacterium]|nr:cytochrome c [Solirubrobacteraceae bacterium]